MEGVSVKAEQCGLVESGVHVVHDCACSGFEEQTPLHQGSVVPSAGQQILYVVKIVLTAKLRWSWPMGCSDVVVA